MILGSAGRSGSTLVRMMLDAHPRIACGPELKLVTICAQQFVAAQRQVATVLKEAYDLDYVDHAESQGKAIIELLERYRQRRGKARVAEKTPSNVHHFLPLSFMLPGAVFVQVIRDGRDVVCSLLQQDWVDLSTGQPLAYTRDPAAAARHWASSVLAGRRISENPAARDRYFELRYEELLDDPVAAFGPLLEAFNESWHPDMLKFFEQSARKLPPTERASHGEALDKPLHSRARGRWTHDMSDAAKAAFKHEAGRLLIELGYASDDRW